MAQASAFPPPPPTLEDVPYFGWWTGTMVSTVATSTSTSWARTTSTRSTASSCAATTKPRLRGPPKAKLWWRRGASGNRWWVPNLETVSCIWKNVVTCGYKEIISSFRCGFKEIISSCEGEEGRSPGSSHSMTLLTPIPRYRCAIYFWM